MTQITINVTVTSNDAAMFRRLRNLTCELDAVSNANDRATVMIAACIEEGMNEAPRIFGAMERLGFNRRHAAIILNERHGDDTSRHWWSRDESGLYAVHANLPVAPIPDLTNS